MLIYLKGASDYLAGRTMHQLKEKYVAKNPSSAELIEVDNVSPMSNWNDLQAVPLFATTRLVLIRGVGLFPKGAQQDLANQLAALPNTTVVAAWDGSEPDSPLKSVLERAEKIIDVTPPHSQRDRIAFLKRRTKELGHELLETERYQELVQENDGDLWALDSALFGLLSGQIQPIAPKRRSTDDQFALFRFVERSDWGAAATCLVEEYQAGKPLEMLIGSIASAMRRSRMAPEKKLPVVALVSDVDFGLKTGLIEEDDAVALLYSYLSRPAGKRVQWEEQWEELA